MKGIGLFPVLCCVMQHCVEYGLFLGLRKKPAAVRRLSLININLEDCHLKDWQNELRTPPLVTRRRGRLAG
jgi:hypothetical protein